MKEEKPKLTVTKPFLPPLEDFLPYLEKIWEDKILTNNGNFHAELEEKLAEYFGVPYVSLFANGTLALLIALQSLDIQGEVITTPFSFVATTHCLWWNNITPVFADIEEKTCNIDPAAIEAAITDRTTAILPVHVYGYPADVERIEQIARKHNLKVIYDAAHTFGSKFDNVSLASFGDLSILSFHATKVFTTFEGGAIISHTPEQKKKIDYLKNFGFAGETTIIAPGINAKMNEFQAALGLLQLEHIDKAIAMRKKAAKVYMNELSNIAGLRLLGEMPRLEQNYSYFPIFIDKDKLGASRDEIYAKLKQENIFARRYFYPLISNFPAYSSLPSSNIDNLPIANKMAEQVLCMPIYSDIGAEALRVARDLKRIIANI